jgi:hypothetical protein
MMWYDIISYDMRDGTRHPSEKREGLTRAKITEEDGASLRAWSRYESRMQFLTTCPTIRTSEASVCWTGQSAIAQLVPPRKANQIIDLAGL